jgi:putative ABC transport system substrate-binding protein
MRRREFIAGLGGAATWPLVARAQQPGMPVVGFLNPGSPTALASRVTAFRDGLNELGFLAGQNVAIEYRWAQGQDDRLPQLAADLVRRQVAVIAATGGTGLVAKTATSAIPIVFTMGGDPVELGLVGGLNRSGGNITGITLISGEVVSKRIGLLQYLIPSTKLIAVLVDSDRPAGKMEAAVADQATHRLGLQMQVLRATGERDLEAAFELLAREPADALLVTTNPNFESRRDQIVALAARYAIPTIYALREYPITGGLMSYGASIDFTYRQAGIYVGRILKGEKPADLPVMQPTRFELVINLRTARALGLTIPETLLATADEVIQ